MSKRKRQAPIVLKKKGENRKKKVAIDVFYTESHSKTVGVIFNDWQDSEPQDIIVEEVEKESTPYIPGQFFRRELPCILNLLEKINLEEFDTVIIDGFISLKDNNGKVCSGLGEHLLERLPKGVSLIGVAKTNYCKTNEISEHVRRGKSTRPLYVQGRGDYNNETAGNLIRLMKGNFRIPTLLKILDKKTKGN